MKGHLRRKKKEENNNDNANNNNNNNRHNNSRSKEGKQFCRQEKAPPKGASLFSMLG